MIIGAILLLFIDPLGAQQIERMLISNSGNQSNTATLDLEWSIGELFVNDFSSTGFRISQGFHQGVDFINKIHESPLWQPEISISPNPVSHRLYFVKTGDYDLNIELLDAVGQRLGQQEWNGLSTSMDVSRLNNGIYLVLIKDDTGNHAFYKFIKQF